MEKKSVAYGVGDYLCMLLIFLFVADPTNTIFHLKNVVFVLFMAYNVVFLKADWAKLFYPLIALTAVFVSWFFAVLNLAVIDGDDFKGVITAFMVLFFLPWSHHYDLIRIAKIPVLVTALLTLLLFWIIVLFPFTEGPIYAFMVSHDNTIMMSKRVFLGFQMFCMYYKSTAAFMVVFGSALYNTITLAKRTWLDVVMTFALLHMFVISGTRSSMMLPMFLAGVICFIYMRNRRYINYIVYPAVFVFMIAFFVLLAMLLMETDEPSNLVKYAHLTSYKELFTENPIYMLIGQGPGTYFYSLGFHKMTLKTEWTYLELLRNYGLFSLLILYVILRPMFAVIKYFERNEVTIAVVAAYVIYLIIAGTNPLLLSSTGMLVLLFMYNHWEKCEEQFGVE